MRRSRRTERHVKFLIRRTLIAWLKIQQWLMVMMMMMYQVAKKENKAPLPTRLLLRGGLVEEGMAKKGHEGRRQ